MLTELFSFQEYERLLWKIISKLAQQGYIVPPGDAQDIIHDFYVDVWPGLVDRYDSSRGHFRAYLVSAFYRFARHRIIKLQSWRSRLVNIEHLVAHADSLPHLEQTAELAGVSRAIHALEVPEKLVLCGRLEGQSERSLCDQVGVSRYRVRELFIDAIGKVASMLGEIHAKNPLDAKVAVALWKEGRTVRDTAALLGIAVPKIRQARVRNVALILDSINQFSSKRSQQVEENIFEFLRNVLLSSDDENLLGQVRERAYDIRQALESGEFELSEEELKQLEDHNEWTAKVYQAFAGTDETPEEEYELTKVIEQMRADEDSEIAQAFVTALETLPDIFSQWESWFTEVPPAPEEYQSYLQEQPTVIAGRPYTDRLITFGMTPDTFVEASRGVELLLRRLIREARSLQDRFHDSPRELIFLYHWIYEQVMSGERPSLIVTSHEYDQYSGRDGYVPRQLLISQLRGTPGCPPEAAEPILRWLIGATQLKPYFISGFRSETRDEEEIQLTEEATERSTELLWRWGMPAEERAFAFV